MMNRRRFTAEFKARVALQALKGDKALHEIAANRVVGARRSRPTDSYRSGRSGALAAGSAAGLALRRIAAVHRDRGAGDEV